MGVLGTLQIYIGVTVSAVFVSLLEPAYKATVTDLLSQEDFSKASGMMQLAASSKYLLSPVLGAVTDNNRCWDNFNIGHINLIITVMIVAIMKETSSQNRTQEKTAADKGHERRMENGYR